MQKANFADFVAGNFAKTGAGLQLSGMGVLGLGVSVTLRRRIMRFRRCRPIEVVVVLPLLRTPLDAVYL